MPLQDAQHVQDPAPPLDSSAGSTATFVPKTPQTRSSISMLDLNAQLFNIALEKTKHDPAHNKRKAAAEEVGWAKSTVLLRIRTTAATEEDDYTGEIPSKVKVLATQFAGLSQEVIAKVFSNLPRWITAGALRRLRPWAGLIEALEE